MLDEQAHQKPETLFTNMDAPRPSETREEHADRVSAFKIARNSLRSRSPCFTIRDEMPIRVESCAPTLTPTRPANKKQRAG